MNTLSSFLHCFPVWWVFALFCSLGSIWEGNLKCYSILQKLHIYSYWHEWSSKSKPKQTNKNLQCNFPSKKRGRAGKDVLRTVCLLHPYYTFFTHKGICTLPRKDKQCSPREKAIRSRFICTSLYLMSKLYKSPAVYCVA